MRQSKLKAPKKQSIMDIFELKENVEKEKRSSDIKISKILFLKPEFIAHYYKLIYSKV